MYVAICFSKGGLFGLVDKQTQVSRGRVDCAVDVAYLSDFSTLKRAFSSPNRTVQDREYKRKQSKAKQQKQEGGRVYRVLNGSKTSQQQQSSWR
jgi:hypothetical protein